jgi:excinuclease UvrABC nuclease subunit
MKEQRDTPPSLPKPRQLTDLYRFFDARGDLIYVGISCHGLRRMFQHRDRQPWFDEVAQIHIEKFKTRSAAEREEKNLIKLCLPRYNIHHAPTVHLLRKRLRGAGSRPAA